MHCPAPLPEELAGPLLMKMLVPAPYEAPKKEDSKKVKKTRSGLVVVMLRTQNLKTPATIPPPKTKRRSSDVYYTTFFL